MDELQDKFPLCVATGSPVCNEIEETRLEQTLTIDQRVEFKLRAGITPTVQEEMRCTLPYDLPGEKWDPLTEYSDRFLISNRRRIRRTDGSYVVVNAKGKFSTDINGKSVVINATKCAVYHFDKSDLRDHEVYKWYFTYKERNDRVLCKLATGESLTPEEIIHCTLPQDLPNEVWKHAPILEGLYVVSNFGRVKHIAKNKILHATLNDDGYAIVKPYLKNGNKDISSHRLVAMAFIPKTEEDIRYGRNQVNHINGNKLDNRPENLEWCNDKENSTHAVKELNRQNKITHDLLAEAVQYLEDHEDVSIRQLSKMEHFNVASEGAWTNAITRRSHQWCKDIPIPKRYQNRSGVQVTVHDILKVKYLRSLGYTIEDIAKMFKCFYGGIQRITANEHYFDYALEDYPEEVEAIKKELNLN